MEASDIINYLAIIILFLQLIFVLILIFALLIEKIISLYSGKNEEILFDY